MIQKFGLGNNAVAIAIMLGKHIAFMAFTTMMIRQSRSRRKYKSNNRKC